jgi:hypothetical protein
MSRSRRRRSPRLDELRLAMPKERNEADVRARRVLGAYDFDGRGRGLGAAAGRGLDAVPDPD